MDGEGGWGPWAKKKRQLWAEGNRKWRDNDMISYANINIAYWSLSDIKSVERLKVCFLFTACQNAIQSKSLCIILKEESFIHTQHRYSFLLHLNRLNWYKEVFQTCPQHAVNRSLLSLRCRPAGLTGWAGVGCGGWGVWLWGKFWKRVAVCH